MLGKYISIPIYSFVLNAMLFCSANIVIMADVKRQMGCITVVLIKMIFWALYKVIMDFALHTLNNQHRSISDHIYNVDNTHANNTPHSPSEDTD